MRGGEVMLNLIFDLQIFGGKGGTTIQSTYEPTEFELELQQLEVSYTSAIMPNALALNSSAATLLSGSIGTIPQDYNTLLTNGRVTLDAGIYGIYEAAKYIHDNTEAIDDDLVNVIAPVNQQWTEDIEYYGNHLDSMKAHVESLQNEVHDGFSTVLSGVNSTYPTIVGGYATAFGNANSKMTTLPAKFEKAETVNSSALDTIAGNFSIAKVIEGDYVYNFSSDGFIVPATRMDYNLTEVSRTNYDDLDKLIPYFKDAADKINPELDKISDGVSDKVSEHFDNYEEIIPHYIPAAESANESLNSISDEIFKNETMNAENLDELIPKFTSINGAVNSELVELADNIEPIRDTHYSDLDILPTLYSGAANDINNELDDVNL